MQSYSIFSIIQCVAETEPLGSTGWVDEVMVGCFQFRQHREIPQSKSTHYRLISGKLKRDYGMWFEIWINEEYRITLQT